MRVTVVVEVEINQNELDKFNRKALRAGRAERTARDFVEQGISNGLKHNFVTADYTTRFEEDMP